MYFAKTPGIVKPLLKDLVWNYRTDEQVVYLTFDDGPTPEITGWVLQTLDTFNAKATFFCVGENVQEHPQIFETILNKGHRVGNHTQHHVNGWKTPDKEYFADVSKCALLVDSSLFRPPYGKITKSQASYLNADYSIIMWDVLSGDFDQTISGEKCLGNVTKNVEKGSIIVFHDSEKASKNLYHALPKVLEALSEQSFRFDCLPT